MHYKKNLIVNEIKIIMGEKDGNKMWQDSQALGIRQLKVHSSQSAKTIILETPWMMPKGKPSIFFEVVANIKMPIRFTIGFKKYMVKGNLGAMKSHNHHVMFWFILPIYMHYQMTSQPCTTVM
jgi:hypothetical protein